MEDIEIWEAIQERTYGICLLIQRLAESDDVDDDIVSDYLGEVVWKQRGFTSINIFNYNYKDLVSALSREISREVLKTTEFTDKATLKELVSDHISLINEQGHRSVDEVVAASDVINVSDTSRQGTAYGPEVEAYLGLLSRVTIGDGDQTITVQCGQGGWGPVPGNNISLTFSSSIQFLWDKLTELLGQQALLEAIKKHTNCTVKPIKEVVGPGNNGLLKNHRWILETPKDVNTGPWGGFQNSPFYNQGPQWPFGSPDMSFTNGPSPMLRFVIQ